jgi:hypothetical protein
MEIICIFSGMIGIYRIQSKMEQYPPSHYPELGNFPGLKK